METEKNFCFVLENLAGGDLFEKILDSGSLSDNIACSYITSILSALNYCHIRGIIHGNIKPTNILFNSNKGESILKLNDFGFSWNISSQLFHKESVNFI